MYPFLLFLDTLFNVSFANDTSRYFSLKLPRKSWAGLVRSQRPYAQTEDECAIFCYYYKFNCELYYYRRVNDSYVNCFLVSLGESYSYNKEDEYLPQIPEEFPSLMTNWSEHKIKYKTHINKTVRF